MENKNTHVLSRGAAGPIETALDWPKSEAIGWALVLHPHPLFGGTNTNKVITTLSRVLVQKGYVVLRPNFRGVGQSAGKFDEARGETADMLQLIEQFLAQHTQMNGLPWILGGFSFGTAVATQLYAELQSRSQPLPESMLLAGLAIWRYQYREPMLAPNSLLVHGEADDVIPLKEVFDWLRPAKLGITVLPGAGHYFHGYLVELKQIVERYLRSNPS